MVWGLDCPSRLLLLLTTADTCVCVCMQSVCNFMVASNAATWVEAVRGTPLTDGVIGLCGVVGASMNIYKYWRKTAK